MKKAKKKVLFSAPAEFLLKYLDKYDDIYDVDFIEIWTKSQIPLNVAHYDAWIPNPGQNFIINTSVLAEFNSLKVISTPSTGTNHISSEDCIRKSVKLFGLMDQRKGLNEISASAEFTFLKILASLRNIRYSWNEVSNLRWRDNENEMRGSEVKEKSFGLIGMGRIGNNIVRYLNAFNAKDIKFYDINVERDELNIATKSSLDTIFQGSDVVVVCVALNNETNQLITYNLLSKLSEGAHLINTSRGEIINEEDLLSILKERPDINFSADVLSGEVKNGALNKDILKLHNENRINITPHIAGATHGSQKKAADLAFSILENNV